LLRLTSEAYRIHLAHLFDPLLAVHTSLIEPLPHQITAVYDEMLTRQPLRYLLADDPQRVNKEMATIVEEIIQRLTSLTGTGVEITLEVSAERPAGFDEATIRTISENS